MSISTLAEQFTAAVDAAIDCRQMPLSWLAEWHIMAAWLTSLRTPLLLPELPDDLAQAETAGLRQLLSDRDAARRLAGWLERRDQLGREVFARGEPEVAADALLRACLTLLELPAREWVYRPTPLPLWRVLDALARMRRWLAAMPRDAKLGIFLLRQWGRGQCLGFSAGRHWPARSLPGSSSAGKGRWNFTKT